MSDPDGNPPGWPYHSSQQHRMGGFTTEALIRWVIQWDRVLDANPSRAPAITELLRRGVSSIRWGYAPPWGRRVPV